MKCALLPRLSGVNSWVKKAADLDPNVRVALEGAIKRWKKRADDVVLDWAELFTDPVALAEGYAGTDVSAKDIERVVQWMRRQLARAQKAPVDEEGKPILDSEGLEVGPDEDDPAEKFDDEDDPILLRLVQLKRGSLQTPNGDEMLFEHVAIDEAQDRSASRVKVPSRPCTRPTMTPKLKASHHDQEKIPPSACV